MNIHKHMEAVFLLTLALLGGAAVAVDGARPAHAVQITVSTQAATATSMAVVRVTAKRSHHAGTSLAMMRDTRASRA